jgi:hypothetical protein
MQFTITITAIGSIPNTSLVVISIQLNNSGLHWTRWFHDPHSVANNHTIGILHVPDSLATTALGDFLIHTVSLRVKVKVILRLTISQSVSFGIEYPPGTHDQIFIAPRLFLWRALSDEWMGLSFICAAGPCQRNVSRVLVPWDLRPYFTVSHLRLPFSSPHATRRVTVELLTWAPDHRLF